MMLKTFTDSQFAYFSFIVCVLIVGHCSSYFNLVLANVINCNYFTASLCFVNLY